mmetsp:Transcript_42757/g.124282  ORF Transcript_42757/g.124282 Transcript_42757/m.124282 type:complete len:249 (+) Transcript_42757:1189-1935(+)
MPWTFFAVFAGILPSRLPSCATTSPRFPTTSTRRSRRVFTSSLPNWVALLWLSRLPKLTPPTFRKPRKNREGRWLLDTVRCGVVGVGASTSKSYCSTTAPSPPTRRTPRMPCVLVGQPFFSPTVATGASSLRSPTSSSTLPTWPLRRSPSRPSRSTFASAGTPRRAPTASPSPPGPPHHSSFFEFYMPSTFVSPVAAFRATASTTARRCFCPKTCPTRTPRSSPSRSDAHAQSARAIATTSSWPAPSR